MQTKIFVVNWIIQPLHQCTKYKIHPKQLTAIALILPLDIQKWLHYQASNWIIQMKEINIQKRRIISKARISRQLILPWGLSWNSPRSHNIASQPKFPPCTPICCWDTSVSMELSWETQDWSSRIICKNI